MVFRKPLPDATLTAKEFEYKMNYATMKVYDIANGPGCRVSLFVSGCHFHCPGCFNQEAQDFSYGKPFDDKAMNTLLDAVSETPVAGLTILGGEPLALENRRGVSDIIFTMNLWYPQKTIWLYTGYTLENLIQECEESENADSHILYLIHILRQIDVLVDGPFIEEQKDITLQFRGSSNQRIIDMKKTLHKIHDTYHEGLREFISHKRNIDPFITLWDPTDTFVEKVE